MKYLIFLIFLLTSCSNTEKEYLYLNTIAISYDNEFNLMIMKFNKDKSIIASSKGKKLKDAYSDLDSKIEISLALNYLSNVIIQYDSINEVIPELLNFITNNQETSLNFYVYTAYDNKEVLDVQGIDPISNTSFHTSPRKCDNIINRKYLDFVIDYKDNGIINLPLLEIANDYSKKSLYSNKMIRI